MRYISYTRFFRRINREKVKNIINLNSLLPTLNECVQVFLSQVQLLSPFPKRGIG